MNLLSLFFLAPAVLATFIDGTVCTTDQSTQWSSSTNDQKTPSWPAECLNVHTIPKDTTIGALCTELDVKVHDLVMWNCFINCENPYIAEGTQLCIDAKLEDAPRNPPFTPPEISRLSEESSLAFARGSDPSAATEAEVTDYRAMESKHHAAPTPRALIERSVDYALQPPSFQRTHRDSLSEPTTLASASKGSITPKITVTLVTLWPPENLSTTDQETSSSTVLDVSCSATVYDTSSSAATFSVVPLESDILVNSSSTLDPAAVFFETYWSKFSRSSATPMITVTVPTLWDSFKESSTTVQVSQSSTSTSISASAMASIYLPNPKITLTITAGWGETIKSVTGMPFSASPLLSGILPSTATLGNATPVLDPVDGLFTTTDKSSSDNSLISGILPSPATPANATPKFDPTKSSSSTDRSATTEGLSRTNILSCPAASVSATPIIKPVPTFNPFPDACDAGTDKAEDCRATTECDASANKLPKCLNGRCQCRTITCSTNSDCEAEKLCRTDDRESVCLPEPAMPDVHGVCQCRPKVTDCLNHNDPDIFCSEQVNCTEPQLVFSMWDEFAQCKKGMYQGGQCECKTLVCPYSDGVANVEYCRERMKCPVGKEVACRPRWFGGEGYCKCDATEAGVGP